MYEELYAPTRCPASSADDDVTLACAWEPGHIGAANGLHWDEEHDRFWHQPLTASTEVGTANTHPTPDPRSSLPFLERQS